MNRATFSFAALAVTAFLAAVPPVQAGTSVGVHIQVGDPYRGGSLVFHKEPDLVMVPQSRVYYMRNYDYDMYRYGSYWYFIDGGYWYRARSYRGPYVHISVKSVPRSVRYVPVKYRRHWKNGPPPHAVARGYYKDKDRHPSHRDHRDRDHYKGSHKDSHKGSKNKGHDDGRDDRQSRSNGRGNKH